MKILGLEFSSTQRSAAIVDSEIGVLAQQQESGGRSTRAIGLIEAALKQAKLLQHEVECIAVGLGPGSYTGIRAALAVAQGWQIANQVKLVGVSSVEAMAAQMQSARRFGVVNIVVDAQRGEFYLAQYEIAATAIAIKSNLRIVTAREVLNCFERGEMVVGPDCAEFFPQGIVLFPGADSVATLAAKSANFVTGEKLEPIYLRETTFVKAPPARVIP